MTDSDKYNKIRYFIASVWFANGLLSKVLNLVPRHEQIVARILGDQHSRSLTLLIGFLEIAMGFWVLSRWKSRWNAVAQMTIVAVMNAIEFIVAPDLLLWGKLNSLFALLFILLVYYNEFHLNKKT